MTKDASFFKLLDRLIKTKVIMGNGEVVQTEGKGSIALQTEKGMKLISDVLFIPKLEQNLLSVPQLINKENSVVF